MQFDKEQDMTMAALNTMPNYNNHRLLRMKDAEKVNKIIAINYMLFIFKY